MMSAAPQAAIDQWLMAPERLAGLLYAQQWHVPDAGPTAVLAPVSYDAS